MYLKHGHQGYLEGSAIDEEECDAQVGGVGREVCVNVVIKQGFCISTCHVVYVQCDCRDVLLKNNPKTRRPTYSPDVHSIKTNNGSILPFKAVLSHPIYLRQEMYRLRMKLPAEIPGCAQSA